VVEMARGNMIGRARSTLESILKEFPTP